MTSSDKFHPGSRSHIVELIASRKYKEAQTALGALYADSPDLATAGFVNRKFDEIKARTASRPVKVAFLRSFSVEPAVPLLKAAGVGQGVDLVPWLGGFNAYPQEILDRTSDLYRFDPDLIILALQTRDVFPDLWSAFEDRSAEEIEHTVQRALDDIHTWIRTLRQSTKARILIHGLELPTRPSAGILDAQRPRGQKATVEYVNRELAGMAQDIPEVYILDYDGLVSEHGRARWHDKRLWLTARMPVAGDALPLLVNEWLKFIVPMFGTGSKVLVTDLDNTLWGGVVGEDGCAGIKIGQEHPGAYFRDLQRAILDLHRRGVILAICSKNNQQEAFEALNRPEMLLRPDHFAAHRINWNDKAQNLREIAEELNLGLDSFAFIDDNPAERLRIQMDIPEVKVIDLPDDPARYADTLRMSPLFDRLSQSQEDARRSEYYVQERKRRETRDSADTVEDYLHGLETAVRMVEVSPMTIPRAAQLTQKTNQFNLTTLRYTESDLQRIQADPSTSVHLMEVSDRFGDSGIVGVGIARFEDSICEIDTLLLSCRVIGRSAETALLTHVLEEAAHRGCTKARGWYLVTGKNQPCRDFYESHGFELLRESGSGTYWETTIPSTSRCPAWITMAGDNMEQRHDH